MDVLPILSTLRRHKTAASLIVLQIALTCAIVCNALFLIVQRLERIGEPNGLAGSELAVLMLSSLSEGRAADVTTRADLQALRALPGVRAVSISNQLPYGDSFRVTGLRLRPEDEAEGTSVADYNVGENWLQATGVRLVAGRDFLADEYQDRSAFEQREQQSLPAVIINQALADKLFPGQSALGQAVYAFGAEPSRVVGVVERLTSPRPGGDGSINKYSVVMPLRPDFNRGAYLIRTADPAQREPVLKAALQALEQIDPKRLVRKKVTLEDLRETYYRQDRSMAWLLAGVCLALLVVTAFGIVGLASFWVQQRTRMIGTRRALGASRGQILRYFQTENFLLTGIGIVLGMVGAYGTSLLLMNNYELPGLPFSYLPVGAVTLWMLGQLAVLAPARRAAALAPVAALRA